MRIAYIVFDGITLLDFIGIYDPISRLKSMNYIPELSWDICSTKPEIKDGFGLTVKCDQVLNDLSPYDMIIVPGGFGTRPLQTDTTFIEWLQTAQPTEYKVSICTGSLLLGAAGFLRNKTATTNFQEYGTVKKYCQTVKRERIVVDGKTITAGAVASSLDLGLYLCELLAGKEAREAIRTKMDYHDIKVDVFEK